MPTPAERLTGAGSQVVRSEGPLPDTIKLSVVIPAYNEELSIATTVSDVFDVLSAMPVEGEIVVVDDGSTDQTLKRARETGARVLSACTNAGYGAALKKGIAATNSQYIAILDADGTYPPNVLPDMYKLATGADMVVGDRGAAMKNVPFMRRPAKMLLGWLANYLAQRKIPDLNSGLRVFRRQSLEPFLPLLPAGFSFTTTITLCMLCSEKSVAYMPVEYGKRVGHSKIRSVDFFNFVLLVLRVIMLFQPLRVFLPVGGVLFALGGIKLGYDLFQWNLSESAILAFLAALIVWSLGLTADMISRLHLRP